MSRLFVYYSNSGNGDFVASVMREKGFNTLKLEVKKDVPNNKILKMLIGGFSALINEKAELKTDISIINNYSEIYVGTPIWNNRVTPAINSILDILKNKKFNLICYSDSGKIKGVIKQLKDYKIENIISLMSPLKNKEDTIKILNKYI